MYELLDHPRMKTWVETRPIPDDNEIIHSGRKGWVAWVQTIMDVLDAVPSLAVDRSNGNVNPKAPLQFGLSPEDLYRGVSILRWAWKKKEMIPDDEPVRQNISKKNPFNTTAMAEARRTGFRSNMARRLRHEENTTLELADLDYDGLNHHDPLAKRIYTNEELNLTAEQIERIQRKRKVPAAG
ncbi:MAG: hypothetical protein L6R38_001887 [Xanthoria sp. 2 TBL-2021]|nr:MAG: hypothetical protein L6R38_001887 [Xanthoria sp. 2 TBL-2021]